MKEYRLHLRYIYTFYSFDEILNEEVFDEYVKIGDKPCRFTLHQQEESSFILSELMEDYKGKYATLTFPDKKTVIVHQSEEIELEYDESFDAMGEINHNVYLGTLAIEEA